MNVSPMRKLFCLLVLLVLVGCGTQISYVPTNSPPQAVYPRTAESVAIFMTGVPDVAYAEIGIMEAHEGAFDTLKTMIDSMRMEAAAHGCDALIITESADTIESDYDGNVETRRGYRAACVVYVDEDVDEPADEPAEESDGGTDQDTDG